jgi:N-acetylmuramoyl-L-alanine amidase
MAPLAACIPGRKRFFSGMSLRATGSRLLLAAVVSALSMGLSGAGQLSPLAPAPDWSSLHGYQHAITRAEFTQLINGVYSIDGAFWSYADIDDAHLVLFSDAGKHQPIFTLQFAASAAAELPRPYSYHTSSISQDPKQPLKGLKIALDPGHIGGDWSKLEARYFKLGDDPPVEEAKLNLITCQRLAERLQADGADIIWAKRKLEPVTDLRPDDLHHEAIAALALRTNPSHGDGYTPSFLFGLPQPHSPKHPTVAATSERIDNEAALLFYRVAEIRARGDVVNARHPDLTICVHYNADDWGDPNHPTLTAQSRLVIFTNGAYEKSELVYDDYKFDLMRKLLDRTAVQEERGCALVGQAMLDRLKYPPENYPGTYFAHHVTSVPSVYARDLLANRIYHGPVIYCEGPYMNARDAYYRIIAGDYLGLRSVQGAMVPSIYREYATAVEQGVLKYFGGS